MMENDIDAPDKQETDFPQADRPTDRRTDIATRLETTPSLKM